MLLLRESFYIVCDITDDFNITINGRSYVEMVNL